MGIFRAHVSFIHPVMPDPGVNTWHVRLDTDNPNAGDMVGLAGHLATFYVDMVSAVLADGAAYTYDGLLTAVGDNPETFDTGNSWAAGNAGSSATLPGANCIAVTWRTAVASRHGKGRSFMGPIKAAVADTNGTVTTSPLTAARAAATALASSNAGIPDGAWGVYSREQNIIRDITSATIKDKFAVLRSRRD